jgi:hypothetical protein
MAAVIGSTTDRRGAARVAAGSTQWCPNAVLRPGVTVTLINISTCGALFESAARLRPGLRTELQLAGGGMRRIVRGRLDRCHVAALDPLCYRGVMVFEELLELDSIDTGNG